MCGIAGILYGDRSAGVDQELLAAMTNALHHRGPDGSGFHFGPGVGLGHRRLAIIDPAGGQQPMLDPDTQNVIVYNGEVYNYVELKAELESFGYRFATRSDTEVILKAYDRWGMACLQRFNGMWAFALWDARQQHLVVARDRLGIKPLHYVADGQRFLFGSEIKSLFSAGIPRRLNLELLDVYLALGYIPGPYSFYHDVRKLQPGHYLVSDGTHTQIRRYWSVPFADEGDMRTDQQQIHAEFSSLLDDAVRISMRSDVPYGAFLSGGLDSGAIVSLMADHSERPVETFTVGFDNSSYDERHLARLVSAGVQSNHHEYVVTPDDLEHTLDMIRHHYDEPFGDSSAVPTGHIARVAAGRVKVVLTGDGGDEVLSGYQSYQVERVAAAYQKIPSIARTIGEKLLAATAELTPRGTTQRSLSRYERLLSTAELPFRERLLAKAAWLDNNSRSVLLGAVKVNSVSDVVSELMKDCPYRDSFYELMYFNLLVSLPDDMLTKVDRMTMAYSIEARVPFLDYRLVELMARVHKSVKMVGVERKSVLRRSTVGARLPTAVLQGAKRGFVVPLGAWFREGDLARRLVNTSLPDFGLSPAALKGIAEKHSSGLKDYGNLIWMLLVLDRVLRS